MKLIFSECRSLGELCARNPTRAFLLFSMQKWCSILSLEYRKSCVKPQGGGGGASLILRPKGGGLNREGSYSKSYIFWTKLTIFQTLLLQQ